MLDGLRGNREEGGAVSVRVDDQAEQESEQELPGILRGLPGKSRVLVVEDDPALQDLLTYNLEQEYFETLVVRTAEEAYALLQVQEYDLVILEHALPGMDGLELLKLMRFELKAPTPVIMLSSKGGLQDRLVGLDLGASDYITKPFELSELVARIKAQLRQAERLRLAAEAGAFRRKIVNFGRVSVDRDGRAVFKDGVEIYLRPKEFELLVYLLERPGVVCSRREIMDGVWGPDSPSGHKAVDVTMRTLRQKVEENPGDPKHLLTVRTVGYKFEF